MQNTLATTATLEGIGLHTGETIRLNIHPAEEDHGIVFRRVDLAGQKATDIPARWDMVADTRLCTLIANKDGASVATIEHIMAALRGLRIDNALIEIDGPEVPSMDGSAGPFVRAIRAAGIAGQDAPRRFLKILKTVEIKDESGKGYARFSPTDGSVFAGEIDFNHPLIGRQSFEAELVNGTFIHELADTRSFCLLKDVEMMRAAGLIKGGSLDNAVVLDDDKVLNEGGMRFTDEPIRHKLLDAIGDTFLCGAHILGRYEGARIGHALNNKLLHAVFADKDTYAWVSEEEDSVEAFVVPNYAEARLAAAA